MEEKHEKLERVTVAQAAEELCISPLTVRGMMECGILPIGIVKESPKRCTYIIYRNMLDEFKSGNSALEVLKKVGGCRIEYVQPN
jgi:hypothetical protein